MQDFEKLGAFYLGRPYDLATRKRGDGWLLYDSRDLVTHGVCVGMTGSGKTGLCLALLEEAAIDGVPAIAIDPKGDLGNLLLTFPELRPEDFQPWVNADDARRGGVSVEDYAAQQAARWKKGLEEWGQDGARIARLKAAADFAIYTPGSEAGLPVSIVRTLAAPAPGIEGEALRDRVATTVGSLLGLLGLDADPVRSRDHILLSNVLQAAWSQGQDLDLGGLIQLIQSPPIARVGVIDLETFYPAKDRFGLAMSLNNLLASPGFASWMEGEPLDVQRMLYTADGKPRVSIFSIAHLGDAERMFFVSMLLGQIVGWMRQQSGTTSLRALVYMDEIFGYFPPVANPPSKLPLLTLLKQGRAFGVGTVLATQNPVDLDYKGLSNAGTWFLGRLQTERDKARVLEGLEGASVSAGRSFDKGKMEQTLAGLGSRVFLMNNVHEDEPVVFESRWALSYLRGPLGRQEIKQLMDPRKAGGGQQAAGSGPAAGASPATSSAAPARQAAPAPAPTTQRAASSAGRPVLPPDIQQFYLPVRGGASGGVQLVYEPMLLGTAQVRFADPKTGIDETQAVNVLTPVADAAVPVDWSAASDTEFGPGDLEREAAEGAGFAALPAPATKAKSYDAWKKAFGAYVYGARKLTLMKAPDLGLVSSAGETEGQFRVRVQQASREQRDEAVKALREKYATRLARLQDQLARAQAAREREASQATAQKLQTAISFGATLLGAFMGRKAVNVGTIGRATTAARGVGRSMKEAEDVKRAELTVEAAQQQIAAIEGELRDETTALETRMASGPFEMLTVAPKKTGITVQLVALAWMPYWQDPTGGKTPAV
jgi:hypothetical protein